MNRRSVSVSTSRLRRIDSFPSVGHLGYKSIDMVSSVSGGLDTPVRKSNGEGSLNEAICILCLCLLEVGLAVIIGYSVLVSIRLGVIFHTIDRNPIRRGKA